MVAGTGSPSDWEDYGGTMSWAQEVEFAVSYDHATTFQSVVQSETLLQRKERKREREK